MDEETRLEFARLRLQVTEAALSASAAMFAASAALRAVPDKAAAVVEIDNLIANFHESVPRPPGFEATAPLIEQRLRALRAFVLNEHPDQASPLPIDLLKKPPS